VELTSGHRAKREMREVFQKLGKDGSVRAIVLTGG